MTQNKQIQKNHMDIPWHQFTGADKSLPITQAGLTEKASVIGRTGLMMLSCGTGAWRVRSSMNSLLLAVSLPDKYRRQYFEIKPVRAFRQRF